MKSLSIITLVLSSSLAVFFFLGKTKQSSPKKAIIKGSEPTFKEFVKGFKKKKGPFKVTAEDLTKYYYNDQNIAKNKKMEIPDKFGKVFPNLEYHKFSRFTMESKYYYYAKLAETDAYTVILYIDSSYIGQFDGGERKTVECKLATFNKEGENIENAILASIGDRSRHMSFSVNKKLKITRKEYKYTYQNDVNEVGYQDNPIIGNTLIETEQFYISKDGKVIKIQKASKATVAG